MHVSDTTSLSLLLIVNGLGIPGRILPAIIADRFIGPLNTYVPLAITAGMLLYCWIAVKIFGGIIAFSIIYGLVTAGVQGLFAAALASLTTDLKKMGVRIGMVLSVVAFACLTGPPVAGALIQRGDGSYLYAQIWGGTSLVVGALVIVAARIAGTGWELRKRM